MKYIKLLPIVFTVACSVQKQVKVNIVKNIDSEKYAATITKTDLNKHLSILASDEFEGRETCQPGQKLAAEYIKNYFETLELTPGNIRVIYIKLCI